MRRSTTLRAALLLVSVIALSVAPASARTSPETASSVQAAGPWADPVAIWSRRRVFLDRGAFAATEVGGTRVLHAGFSGSVWERINYGLRYARSTDGGATWTVSKRLNSERQAANHVHVSAAGSRVYLAWFGWTPGAKGTAIYFRSNRDSGAPSAWRPTIRLTTASERPRSSELGASGEAVYVLYRDKRAKSIYLKMSRDHGRTWSRQRLIHWQDVVHGAQGPALAVSGATVAVAWKIDGRVETRISINGGHSFGPVTQAGLIDSSIDHATIAALGSRVVVGWTDSEDRRLIRTWSAGTWAAPVEVPMASDTFPKSPELALRGTAAIGVLFTTETGYHWRYTPDGGVTWAPEESPPLLVYSSVLLRESGEVDMLGAIARDDGTVAVEVAHRTSVDGTSPP